MQTRNARTLEELLEGNCRFVSGAAIHPQQTARSRQEVAGGQHPKAIVVGCSDSRVPPEIVFDQGLGDLFVVRAAGNVLDDHAIGSIEYAVEHLHVPLIVVLGHTRCGAVTAAAEAGEASGRIAHIVEAIRPAIEEARREAPPQDVVEAAICINVRRTVDRLRQSEPILARLAQAGELALLGASYDLETGKVWLLEEPPRGHGEVRP
jgi:carbonic anhydrase